MLATKCEFGGTVQNAPSISANFATATAAVGYDVAAAIGLGLSADGATAVDAEITVEAVVAVFPVVVVVADVVVVIFAMDAQEKLFFYFVCCCCCLFRSWVVDRGGNVIVE